MNKEQLWKALQLPTEHNCDTCIHHNDMCEMNTKCTAVWSKQDEEAKDLWEWDKVNVK